MATTTNFGWETPDDTDLVKDGAAAIRTALGGVDTSFVDLKGGTTGQVLSKASNTDLDYTWVTTDDANAIQNAIVDAKGDLIAASAADTPARLAVGNNGETLVADSSTSTGLRYQEPLNLNPVLNSGFDIWQRGTASTAIGSGTFLADRWQAARSGFAAGASQSRQATGDTTNLPNIQYCLRVQRDSGNTSTAFLIVGQNVESVNSIPYAGKTVTFSFYARAGANFSAASSILSAELSSGTGTDQNIVTSGTLTGIDRTTSNHTLTTTWQRFTFTKSIAATATQLALDFVYTPVGTAGAADYFEVTGVMINVGSVAYPFRRTTGTIQGELAACQRYYYRTERDATSSSAYIYPMGSAITTSEVRVNVALPQKMRTSPSAVSYSNLRAYDGSGFKTLTSVTFAEASTTSAQILLNSSAAFTLYRPTWPANDGDGFIAFSAEL